MFSFVQEIDGVEFKEALKLLADKAGVQLRSYDPQVRSEKARLYERLFGYRDISEEVRFLNRLFTRHGVKKGRDIACCHAPHGSRLAYIGYSVSGLDVSASLL